ncbi:transmembrane protein [Arabidopsis thaliana]|uniref:Transmembrane protein n=1 Tax=Arabidopsis thaliana TaxID=3702 RepID=F4IBX8_ARATH|nr:uncharacterized protein AT1G78922 [Arabidopsis thaliana]AEE36179.1 transmembrane protein [Arabidopsis thaliana]|eukprot:NP_001117620.1 transmembrane protein [Arabidopsis thaliana]
MGNAIGKASNDIGGFIGNIFTAPLKATLGRSCLDVCSGPWDLECFIEHFCLPDIAKLVLMSSLCFIILMFITLLFKLGICQCVVKSICKMSCAACAAYWFDIGEMISCLCHSLTNINRVNRRRKRLDDIEATTYDYPSDDESSSSDSPSRIDNIRPKQRRRRLGSKHSHHHHGSNRNNRRLIRLPSRQLSVRVGGKSRRVRRSTRKIKSRKIKTLKVKDVVD